MFCKTWLLKGTVLTLGVVSVGGCVSMGKHGALQRANRQLIAERQKLSQDLFDERSVTDNLRNRVRSLESELEVRSELVNNLQRENELLDEMRQQAVGEMGRIADKPLGAIAISGPQLPAQLDTALKDFADQHSGAVEYDRTTGTIKWKADLLFALGSDVVRETSLQLLQQFAEIIKSPNASQFEVFVVGHTDSRPITRPETRVKHPSNWHLSSHRAIAISDAIQKAGYPSERISVVGCGEFRPVADNGSEAGAAQNRRVDVYLIPVGSIVRSAQVSAHHPTRDVTEAIP